MGKKYLGILGILAVFSLSAEEETIEEIISIASKAPEERENVIATVDVLDSDDLNKQAPKDVLSFLSNSLALDVSSNGGPGQYASIFLRGANSNQSLIKVNGVKINPSTAGGASINNLDVTLISKIEVGSGPFSSTHGSEAIGGVINIWTIGNQQDTSLSMTISGGPDNFTRESLQRNWGTKDKSFNLVLLNSRTEGFPSLSSSQINRGYTNKSLVSSFINETQQTSTLISTWFSEGNTEYLDFQGNPLSQKYKNSAHALDVTYKPYDLYWILVSLNSSKDFIYQNQDNFLGLRDLTETNRNNLEIVFHKPILNRISFSLGYILESENVNYSSYGTRFRKHLKTKSLIAESFFNSNKQRAFLKLRLSEHDSYGNQFSWNFNYMKNLEKNWSVRLSSGFAFRSPNSSELYGYGANVNLKPENSRGHEISANKKHDENEEFSIVLFKNDIKNLITFDFHDYLLKNIEQSSTKGLELRYKWNHKFFKGKLVLRSQDPKDQMGNQLIRRSRKSMSINLYRDLNLCSINLNLVAFDKRKDFDGTVLPGYGLIHMSFTKEISEQLGFSIRLENIFDKEYFTAAGSNGYYRNQGRSIWLNSKLKIRR